MICKYCGKEMDDNCKFCVSCGRSIEFENAEQGALNAAVSSDASAAVPSTNAPNGSISLDKPVVTNGAEAYYKAVSAYNSADRAAGSFSSTTENVTAEADISAPAPSATPATPVTPTPVTPVNAVTTSVRYDPVTGEKIIISVPASGGEKTTTRVSEVTAENVAPSISHTIPTGMTMNNPNYCAGSIKPRDDASYGTPIDPAVGGKNDVNLHVGTPNPSDFLASDKPIQPNSGVDLSSYVPPKKEEKPFKVYSTGHMVFCVVIITLLAVACGVFASLFFTTRERYNDLKNDYNAVVELYNGQTSKTE